MSKVRFSVNVPVYNAEKYLRQCIDSILNQTFTDFELLLIDDGSTDSSAAICDEYAKKDSRIRVFHNDNQGSFATRVFSIRHASGEYCSFCDSDDFYDAGYLERADALIREENCDVVLFCQDCIIDGERKVLEPKWSEKKVFAGDGKKEFYSTMLSGVTFNSLNIKVIKTQLLQSDTLETEKYSFVKNGDDFLQSLYPIFNAEKIVFVPESYYNYRINPEGLTHKIDPNIYNSLFAVRTVIWNDYLDGTDILGENTKQVFVLRSARSAMNIVKLIAQCDNLTDEEKIEVFRNIHNHEFYRDFVEPNLVKSELEKKWQFVYELFSRHSYKLLLSTVRMLTKIKNNSR